MIFKEKKKLGVVTYSYFILFYLRENKIRKKTLSVTFYLEKTVSEKTNLGSGVKLPY